MKDALMQGSPDRIILIYKNDDPHRPIEVVSPPLNARSVTFDGTSPPRFVFKGGQVVAALDGQA